MSTNHCSTKGALSKLIAPANTELIAHTTYYIIAKVSYEAVAGIQTPLPN